MNRLEVKIDPKQEHVVKIASCDLFRPGLKQIGDSLAEIVKYFSPSDAERILIFPSTLSSKMKEIRDCLENIIEESTFFQNQTSNDRKGFVYMAESLVPVLSIPTPYKPCKCDILVILPNQPVTVLTIVQKVISDDDLKYNVSIARGTVGVLGKFLNKCVNVICGVIRSESLNSNEFDKHIDVFRKRAQLFVTPRSLSMTLTKFEKVVLGFWASSALTTSVVRRGEKGKFLRFLTKDQCQILLENLDKAQVVVGCVPKSGATTLMIEVAKRLSLLEDTAIVCESQEYDSIRYLFPSTFSWQEEPSTSTYRNVVCDRTDVGHHTGKCWTFSKVHQDEEDADISSLTVPHSADKQSHDQPTSIHTDLFQKFRAITGDSSLKRVHTTSASEKYASAIKQPQNPDEELELINEIRKNKKHIAQLQAKADYLEEEQAKRYQTEVTHKDTEQEYSSRKRKLDEEPKIEFEKKRVKNVIGRFFKFGNIARRSIKFQYEKMPQREMTRLVNDIQNEIQALISELERRNENLEKDVGNRVFVVGEIDSSNAILLSFPDLQLDRNRANTEVCYVTDDGLLTNEITVTRSDQKARFRRYRGTCTTSCFPPRDVYTGPRHMYTHPFTYPAYWETRVHGWIRENALVWRIFFEVGVVEESQLDKKYMASGQDRSWSITLADCTRHEGICTKVNEMGKHIKCLQTPMVNETDSKELHHFGTVIDVQGRTLAFLDVTRRRIVHVFDVDVRENLYPVCGLWLYPGDFTAKIELISGRNIEMTDRKAALIHRALLSHPSRR